MSTVPAYWKHVHELFAPYMIYQCPDFLGLLYYPFLIKRRYWPSLLCIYQMNRWRNPLYGNSVGQDES